MFLNTIWAEVISIKTGDAQNVLVEIFHDELHGIVPLGVERARHYLGPMLLAPDSNFTIWITFT